MVLANRRTIIKGGAALAIAASLPVGRKAAFAGDSKGGRNLIVVWLGGGWDTTYVFEPKPGISTIDSPSGVIKNFGALTLYTDSTRPKVTSFFEKYGSISAVINGIQLQAINHPECTVQMLTGTRDRGAPDFAAIAAHELGNDLPLPYLISGSVAFTGPLTASAGRIGTSGQLLRLLDPANAVYRSVPGSPPLPSFVPGPDQDSLISSFVRARARRLRSAPNRGARDESLIDDFLESLDRGDQLKGRTKALTAFQRGDPALAGHPLQQQLKAALTAIKSDVSHSVIVGDRQSWDTHAGNDAQTGYLENVFPALEGLARDLEADHLLDKTVIVVLSEMGRTPKLNASQGKDHWPVTSALVFGAGVKSGVYGGTDDSLQARPVDFSTGVPTTNGNRLKTDNVLAGLLALLGVDPAPHFAGVDVFDPFVA